MDQNSVDFSVQKEKVLHELLDIMIKALEAGTLTAVESDEASKFISENFDLATDIYYVQATVEQLADRWPAFRPALVSFQSQQIENADQAKIAETEEKIEELQNQPNQ